MSPLELAGLAVYLACWLGYAPLLRRLPHAGGVINANLNVVRTGWMTRMALRKDRFIDSALLGHAINSASFFASSNLILIAALTGALVGGERTWSTVHNLPLVERTAPLLFEAKLALIVVSMARSLLDFIWSIRQLNYCLAAIGALPLAASEETLRAYAAATASILNPALGSFSAGVRGYYFALAAAGWLLGPIPLIITSLGATFLLAWRQLASPSAHGLRQLRLLIDSETM
ncbi:DUF599 family protein [Phenylobacterium montanum]|uniref:DUF599 family protein n=1 Tax=Phenylobacterium montanum TaxID=2823693 RepID=A0A975G4Z4_9CAUL|nr:DUF599 family protein [Caulobacter sp. S6]